MSDQEVGVTLSVEGEKAFYTAMDKAEKAVTDFDRALEKMAQQEKNSKMLEDVRRKLDGMTDAEKDAAIAAVQLDGSARKASLTLTDVKSAFDMVSGAVTRAYNFVKQFIDAASDLNETTSKSRVVFGDMSDAVERMGANAATTMGMSKNAAIGAAATYGNLFVSMGMTKEKSAEMSMTMVQLAADFASFNNIGTDEALEKIRAGLVGETEPLKSLGIILNEAAIKAEALALGLYNGKGEIAAAAKAQAAYSLILKQSATAQGDFAKTADQAANQARILQAQTDNLNAALGQRLLPTYNKFLQKANDIATTFDIIADWGNKMNAVLQQHSKELAKTKISWEDYSKEMVRAKLVSMNFAGTEKEVNDLMRQVGPDLEKTIVSWGFLGKAQLEAGQAAARNADKIKFHALEYQSLAKSVEDLSKAYSNNLAGGMAIFAAQKDYQKSYDETQSKVVTLTQRIDALSRLKYKTPEQIQQLTDLRGELEKEKGTLVTLEQQHTASTNKMIFDMLLQKAASDGLTKAEFDNLMKIGVGFGIVDEKSATMASNLNAINLDDANAELGGIDGIIRSIMGQPSSKDITVTTTYKTVGSPTMAPGDWGGAQGTKPNKVQVWIPDVWGTNEYGEPEIVTPGHYEYRAKGGRVRGNRPYIVGEDGVEVFIPSMDGMIIPNDLLQSMKAIVSTAGMPVQAPSMSYSYQNSYNLQVMTNNSPQAVLQSFELMKLMAG